MNAANPQDPPPPLHPQELTWAVLLARWVDFARSALSLPDNEEGHRLRESVADIIGLQAVWFALGEMDELDAAQRAVGLDRAEVLIECHAQALGRRFGNDLPALVAELIADAREQLRLAQRGLSGH